MQELATCKKIGYEFYCKALYVVNHKTKYSCRSAIYFDLNAEIVTKNCQFQYHFNAMEVKPVVPDGGHKMVLANWPDNKHVICNDNNNIPIKVASHPYVLINKAVLCNWQIEAEDNFLLEINSYVSRQTFRFDYVFNSLYRIYALF